MFEFASNDKPLGSSSIQVNIMNNDVDNNDHLIISIPATTVLKICDPTADFNTVWAGIRVKAQVTRPIRLVNAAAPYIHRGNICSLDKNVPEYISN